MAARLKDLPADAGTFWQRPPARDHGDEKPEPLWQAIGSSLTSFEMLEDVFGTLFRVLVESPSPAAGRAYGAISSARGRREALEAAAEIFFSRHNVSQDWQDEFSLLMKHFAHASGRRNEIAHSVSIKYIGYVDEEHDSSVGHFLTPPQYNTRKTYAFRRSLDEDKWAHLRAKYRYTASDVSEITSRFLHLHGVASEWLMNFWIKHGPASETGE